MNTPHQQHRYDRRYSEHKGRRAEFFAALLLFLKGYQILARRWKTRLGEVDIIARKKSALIFVEVKARASHQTALEAVTTQNRRRIEKAASIFVSRKRIRPVPAFRYDIITVKGFSLQHHRDAWRSGD